MAQNKGFSLDFDGFLDLAEDIDEKWSGSENALIPVVKWALDETKNYVNVEIGKALKDSKYNFTAGVGYSQGKARESLIEVSQMPLEVVGNVVTAYAGFDLSKAPEVLILAYGTPHLAKDKKLYNAIKVKGKVKKQVEQIQKHIFNEGLNGNVPPQYK